MVYVPHSYRSIGLVGFASLAWLASLTVGCSDRGTRDVVASEGSAVVGGEPSPEEENFVVLVSVAGHGTCSGTLIAPNAVLTALHCVNEWDAFVPFLCNESDGTVQPVQPGGGTFTGTFPAEEVAIRVGPAPIADEPAAFGSRIFGSGSSTLCRDDIAVVVLDRNLEPPPRSIRLGKPLIRGDYETIIGYGQTESASAGVRHRRAGLRVLAVGEYGSHRAQGVAIPRSFLLGPGPCHADSGGPVIDEETGAVTGVISRLEQEECQYSDPNVAIQVAPFETLVREALDFAGFDPLVEESGEGGAGAGGSSGAAAGAAGVGGEAAGAAGANEGGAPGSAGSDASTAGADTGEGGDPSSGSGNGGSDGTGPAGGAGNDARGGNDPGGAGEGPGRAGSAGASSRGTRVVTEGGCGCRLEGSPTPRGAAWAFSSLLLAAALRRRKR